MGRQVLVIGVGRFGSAVARELERLGHEVLAIDRDARAIEDIADDVTHAIIADATDKDVLRKLGAQDFDVAVVAIGTDERSSILATTLLNRLGIKRVVAKAQNPLHGEILKMVGADRVVYPESETGTRLAHSLTMPLSVSDYFDVGPGYGLAKLSVASFAGKTLDELQLRSRYGVTPLFLRRGDKVIVNPHGSERLTAEDELTVAGKDEQLEKLFL
ncbi:potassium channel family protein [Sphaerobacter thermophilus]|uniref:TrkA-N domain protein n=1 Tax=Sphaerobacter thermophilus (strain ATCC 49802 / DSM 20745 / KCCM 41009 / NCIMB 13125 / S 6022) TaxID=479434 RepID=D1C996_SPHTD|nr:TrkA family potassium uptake protein [Sphaerobacter thermophilus]ACZ40389.1 TrkA-N domain protein [Sphaerobacter thermophilus DSM 20745]